MSDLVSSAAERQFSGKNTAGTSRTSSLLVNPKRPIHREDESGAKPMSISIDVTTEIDRPVEEVFEFVATIENDGDWKGDLNDIQLPDGALGWNDLVPGD